MWSKRLRHNKLKKETVYLLASMDKKTRKRFQKKFQFFMGLSIYPLSNLSNKCTGQGAMHWLYLM